MNPFIPWLRAEKLGGGIAAALDFAGGTLRSPTATDTLPLTVETGGSGIGISG